jgi:hypothetical protein
LAWQFTFGIHFFTFGMAMAFIFLTKRKNIGQLELALIRNSEIQVQKDVAVAIVEMSTNPMSL